MQKILVFILPVLLIFSCKMKEKSTDHVFEVIPVTYPDTRPVDVKDDYHGMTIADPYRWLEIDTASEVEAWVERQNDVTYGYLEKIPFRDAIKSRYEKLFNYEKLSAPIKVGGNYFFYKNDGLQNQAVIYVQKGLDGDSEVFIDPNKLSNEGTTAISLLGGSTDDKYMAYAQQEAGSDWQQIKVMEIATKKEMPDQLKWVKFSGAAWDANGFFYSRYPEPKAGLEYSQDIKFHSIYYHKLGDDQSKDKLIYKDEKHPDMYHWCNTTTDDKFLIMYAAPGTNGYATYYMDLSKSNRKFEELFPGYTNKTTVVAHHEGSFLSLTDIDAPNYRLVSVNPSKKDKSNWKEILPQKDDLLESVSTGGGKLFAKYLTKATNMVFQMEMDGTRSNVIELPGTGSVFGFSGKKDQKDLFYTYTSFVYPSIIFKYNVETTKSEPFFESKLAFDPSKFEEKQIMYKSKDGTEVSMFIVHKKGLELDGKNPTFLYGYGGFNNSMTPYFSASRVILLENGGVFAMPNLRGGGEYGEEWHKDGMLFKKQNVFDDFISAAEYLIAEKYTSSDKLAIAGGSNGGLLVGACMTQRPELFAVTFPAVGVMDMLRYHKFTVGKGWIPEYGSSDEADHFKNLYAYSPLHNLKDGVEYPATMITTADHDDRVVPAHSFKFAATLQKAHKGDNPALIRIETNAGHGAGKPTSKIIEEQADQWSFFFQNTNSPVKY